jgi:conjugal transfer/entry exclusion protein
LQLIAIVAIQKECQIFINMIQYTNSEQARILNTCNTATELIETKELLEQLQPISHITQLVYDRMMCYLLVNNCI